MSKHISSGLKSALMASKYSLSLVVFIVTVSLSALAQSPQRAIVNLSSIYLRLDADYESALETQELMGTVVEVLETKGYWRKVKTAQPYTAWCTEMGIVEKTEVEIEDYLASPKYIVTSLYSHAYSSPSPKSQTVCDLVCGDVLRMADRASKRGFVAALLPSNDLVWISKKDLQDYKKWSNSRNLNAENIIKTAKQFLGVPYLWGGMTSKGLDCSGLVRLTYLLNGHLLPRNASQQIHCGLPLEIYKNGVLELSQLQRGDLVFFGRVENGSRKVTHVAIYIGDGKIIHSSHLVRINSLVEGSQDYYLGTKRIVGASRIIGYEAMEKDKF